MSIDDIKKRITLPELFKSNAFVQADDKWRFESWDDKQWDKIINQAIKEKANV